MLVSCQAKLGGLQQAEFLLEILGIFVDKLYKKAVFF